MKIAFVGKGGSGKSTVSVLFFLELIRQGKKVVFIDADLNMHLRDLLTIEVSDTNNLSLPKNMEDIRVHMIGDSKHIDSPNSMYYSTPPSHGCNLLTISDADYILKNYFSKYSTDGYIGEVGTYTTDVIGTTCYHTNLAILENILRFSNIKKEEYLIADMVAGVDAFANTMYAQFDVFIIVVEPTAESLAVFEQYIKLATNCGITHRIKVIYNKIQNASDSEFLDSRIDQAYKFTTLPELQNLKQVRREGKKLDTILNADSFTPTLATALPSLSLLYTDQTKYIKLMHDLHAKCSQEDWITHVSGDITTQIDPNFTYD